MTLFMPSVMTIGEIFSLATPTPLTNPAPIPTANAAVRPAQRWASWPCVTPVKTMLALVMVQAIERSMPPVRITTVSPMPAMPR